MEENQEQNQNANGGAQYQGTMNNGNVNAQYQGAMNNANGNVQYQAGANNLNGTFDTERLKTETASTVNQVKETFKNVNIKQDSIETKNFVIEMFLKPVDKIKEVIEDNTGKTFKYAIIMIAIWVLAIVIDECFKIKGFSYLNGTVIWNLVKTIIVPVISILVISVIILLLSRQNKKSLTTIITSVTIANIPQIISAIISLLIYASYQAYKIILPISTFCTLMTTVLTYFAIKYLFDKNDSDSIKTFALVEVIYIIMGFILSYLGITI